MSRIPLLAIMLIPIVLLVGSCVIVAIFAP